MSAQERQEAGLAFHDFKQGLGKRDHMTYGDLLAWLRQWKEDR